MQILPMVTTNSMTSTNQMSGKNANDTLLNHSQISFKDYAYQLALTHVEYVDRKTRGTKPVPSFDFKYD